MAIRTATITTTITMMDVAGMITTIITRMTMLINTTTTMSMMGIAARMKAKIRLRAL